MKPWLPLLGISLTASALIAAQEPAFRLSEPWQTTYAGGDATGKHVIALWQFDGGSATNDASGHGHPVKLYGAQLNPRGRFGSCLESFPGWPVEDKRHAAVADNHPALTPKGAFTVEMWIQPKPELTPDLQPFLLDKKYVANADYQLILTRADKGASRRLTVNLGFGDDSAAFNSEPAEYKAGVWYHLAFTYDGAGEVRFYRDGSALGKARQPGRGPVVAGRHALSIGDRFGSYHNGFPGFIDQVRICNGVLEFRPAAFEFSPERTTFVRLEQAPPFEMAVRNLQKTPLQGAQVFVSVDGQAEQKFAVSLLVSGASQRLRFPTDTTLHPGSYAVRARLEIPGERPYRSEEDFAFVIVPRPLPHRMPVVMWGIGQGAISKEIPRLKEIGFTHCLGMGADYARVWDAGQPTLAAKPEAVAEAKQVLNEALANDIGVIAQLSPGHWAADRKEFQRVDSKGKAYPRADVCGQFKEVQRFCYNVGASVAQTYGAFPALQAALIHTEVRDHAQVCFHEQDRAAFRQFAGLDIPEAVKTKAGVKFGDLKGFPANRVIPDRDPILQYYRWFWKDGDGWSPLHTAVHRGLKSTGRQDLWTFHDPAVRVASVWGSGGEADVISQWTYSYPDPLRIGMATDQLFAMARGAAKPQQVMKMTQIIWYRSQTAPEKKPNAKTAGPQSVWEDTEPDARFVTIAPMHLREAFWTKLSRPIQGIMYHGWQSLVPTDSTGGYRYTNPQTQHELKKLIHEVVQPFGPTLMQVPDRPGDVAFLDGFTAQMFARRGNYGWSHGWTGDAYLMLQYAQLQPEIIYDETIHRSGLDRFKVLVLMDCDVLTETLARKIHEFQAKGGLVIGDDRLCPAIKPNIKLQSRERTKKADEDRAALLALAAQLRKELDAKYSCPLASDNPNVITRLRRFGSSDYVFAVNDLREFGDYVGQHGLVMENGLPSKAALALRRKSGHVYDLLARREVSVAATAGQLRIPVDLGPCEGRVFLVTEQAIAKVSVNAPVAAKLGESVRCKAVVAGADGKPLDAIVPLKLEVLDPGGRPAEFSGYYGAASGQVDVKLDLARNDSPGLWRIQVTELASGLTASHYLRVSR